MSRTPGLIVPSAYSSKEELEKDLQRRSKEAGFVALDVVLAQSASDSQDPFIEQNDAAVDFLSHYGVKGMKWGRRSASATGGKSKSGLVKEAPSEDASRVNQIHGRVKAQKSTKPLSNKELQDAITRMNLEQQYSKMSGGLDKTTRQKVTSFLKEALEVAVKGTVQDTVKSEVKDAFGPKKAAAPPKNNGGKS